MGQSYKKAGVDIKAGNALVDRIRPLASGTDRPGVMSGIGGFGAFFDPAAAGYSDPVLVASTDGVGTKLRIAIETGRHETIGIDLVAMCVNDLIVQGAEPLFFLDYLASGKLDVDQAESVLRGVAEGCRRANCALIGGETAEMPGMYAIGDYDLAGFAVGAVERGKALTGEAVRHGDILLGLASDGVHSNGYSLVRNIVAESGLEWDDAAPFNRDASLADSLLTPTRIYVRALLPVIRAGLINGLAHITGGGLNENVPRMLPAGLDCRIERSWPFPEIFQWLQQAGGVDDNEMTTVFNCGIGMVCAVSPDNLESVAAALSEGGETVYEIGAVTE